MAEESTEHGEGNPKEFAVELGQEFSPFDRRFEIPKRGLNHEFQVTLKGSEEKLPADLDINFGPYGWMTDTFDLAIKPFDPEKGYRVDKDDMDKDTREAKIATRRKNKIEHQWYTFSPHVSGKSTASFNAVLANPDLRASFERLRLQVTFPNSSYEAKPSITGYSNLVDFYDFYPLDTGPLPEVDGMIGNPLMIDTSKNHLIRARFTMAPNNAFDPTKPFDPDSYVPPGR